MFFRRKEKYMPEQLCCCRYAYNAWKRVRPDSTEEEWANANRPYNMFRFAIETFEEIQEQGFLDLRELQSILVITIDDEYFEWLEAKGLEHSQQTVTEYAEGISEEDALRLLCKNKMDINMAGSCFLMHVIIPQGYHKGRTEFTVSKKTHEALQAYLNNAYNTDVYVLPYYMLPDVVSNDERRLETIASIYYTEGRHILYGDYETQYLGSSEIQFVGLSIPYFTYEKIDSAVLRADNIMHDANMQLNLVRHPWMVAFTDTREDGMDPMIVPVGDLNRAGITQCIKADFKDCEVEPILVPLRFDSIIGFETKLIKKIETLAL